VFITLYLRHDMPHILPFSILLLRHIAHMLAPFIIDVDAGFISPPLLWLLLRLQPAMPLR